MPLPCSTPPLTSTALPVPVRLPEPEQVPEPQVLPSATAADPAAPVVRPQDAAVKAKAGGPSLFKPKPAAAPKATGSNDLSDFGGRR